MDRERWQQIERVYNSAVELKPGDRQALLEKACAGDEELRKEVERLLARQTEAEDFIESPAMEVAARAMADESLDKPHPDLIDRTLLHYCITEKIGEGGMGVVYKARDTHLDRPVAIKVLAAEAVADPERKRRFVQEAKAASALNHPGITAIYDIDRAEGIDFIAMEYVAGKTLDQCIGPKGLPVQEALRYAIQITEALEAAHASGIIHRDLKPANVMVTEKGGVKVLDFGLAKLTQPLEGDDAAGTRSLMSSTGEGRLMGTVAYMSPEQAEGRKVDSRSDIFSFGSVLYEMLTGQRAFQGGSVIDTLSAILHSEPKPLNTVAGAAPEDLDKIIQRCLRKDPDWRFQHIEDVKVELGELQQEGVLSVVRSRRRKARRLVWATGVLLALSFPVLWYFSRRNVQIAPEPLDIVPFSSYPGYEVTPRLSPDAEKVAFSWDGEAQDNWDIYVKQVGPGEPIRLTTDAGADGYPVWSPDGREIAFVRFSGGAATIYTVPALGGAERKLRELQLKGVLPVTEPLSSLSWSQGGLAFSEKRSAEEPVRIYLMSPDTRETRPLTCPPADSRGDLVPEFSPDGRHLAFMRLTNALVYDCYIQPVSSCEAIRLTFGRYSSCSQMSWTQDQRELVFRGGTSYHRSRLLRVSVAGGEPQHIPGIGENTQSPSISGRRMLFEQYVPMDFDIGRLPGPTFRGTPGSAGVFIASSYRETNTDFSPDGTRIAFESDRSGFNEIWVCGADGTRPVQLTRLARFTGTPRWSPDGRRIAFDSRPEDDSEIYVIDADGGAPQQLTHDRSEDILPSWSRDGTRIYFASRRSGIFQVWRIPSRGGDPVQLTTGGGLNPIESWDAKYVYFAKMDRPNGLSRIWKVPVTGGKETLVLDRAFGRTNWVVMPEGMYFATNTPKGKVTEYAIELLNLQTGKVGGVFKEDITSIRSWLTISPDSQWFLYTYPIPGKSDLMLVENFR